MTTLIRGAGEGYQYPYRFHREKIPGVPCTATDKAGENQVTVYLRADGYVVGASSTRAKSSDPMAFLASTRDRYPLAPEDIVL